MSRAPLLQNRLNESGSEELGLYLKAARVAGRVSLDEAALNLELSAVSLVELEKGCRAIGLDEVCALANLYNLQPDDALHKLHLINYYLFSEPDL